MTSGLTGTIPRARRSASLLSKKPSGRAPFTSLVSEPTIFPDVWVRSLAWWIPLFPIFSEWELDNLSKLFFDSRGSIDWVWAEAEPPVLLYESGSRNLTASFPRDTLWNINYSSKTTGYQDQVKSQKWAIEFQLGNIEQIARLITTCDYSHDCRNLSTVKDSVEEANQKS